MGKEQLFAMGPMSSQRKKVALGFIIALLGWGTTMWTGYNANAIAITLAAFLFATEQLIGKDVLNDKAAWDTVVWFGIIISLATGLTSLGFIKWMSAGFCFHAHRHGLDGCVHPSRLPVHLPSLCLLPLHQAMLQPCTFRSLWLRSAQAPLR